MAESGGVRSGDGLCIVAVQIVKHEPQPFAVRIGRVGMACPGAGDNDAEQMEQKRFDLQLIAGRFFAVARSEEAKVRFYIRIQGVVPGD